MAADDDFEPRLGRMRSGGGKKARRYLGRVLAAANLAGVGMRRSTGSRTFSGARIGRGAGAGRLLASRLAGSRRVIVKASIVKMAGKGASGAMAHLRYLQRDGTARDGEPGALYDRNGDAIDARDFHDRCVGDRHQFRFIVSPEDGDQFDDLKPLTHRLMQRVEEDLGTRLDWVAVDHFNTGHPHIHIVVRGVDDRGKDLVIARDYLTRGIRERAAELVELDLGPPTEREISGRLRRETGQERLTSIDRALLREAGPNSEVSIADRSPIEQSLRAERLQKLTRLGLAEPLSAGRFRLAEGLEVTLRRMGERGDIIRTMQREFAERGIDRATTDQAIFDAERAGSGSLVGRLMARGLADEAADRHYAIVDATDGRAYYVDLGRGADTEVVPVGAIVAVTQRAAGVREADRTIAAVAVANRGHYDPDAHLAHDPAASDAFAEAHVRRLEAARRGGVGVERAMSGRWKIPADYVEQVERWERSRVRAHPVSVDILSVKPLEQLVSADAATWLDRDAATGNPVVVRSAGFGGEVEDARARRGQWLVAQDLASEEDGALRYRRNAIQLLQQRDLEHVGSRLAQLRNQPFSLVEQGERIEGVMRQRIDLTSGRFALVERSRDFVLVPWRPTLDQAIGKPVSGIMREQGASWTIGRGRSGPAIS